jgi:hypothetical protein
MSYERNHGRTHWDAGHNWALVLAAGEGSRLQALTTIASGVAVPKQFCSFGGGTSLLHDAISRAAVVAAPERITTVVAEHHQRWWRELRLALSAENVVKQPRSRGTAIGILLPLLHILHRDPDATVLVLPSDHYVRNEDILASSLRKAMVEAARRPGHILLLGITPDESDPELGYIVSEGNPDSSIRTVTRFVEKPNVATARALIARGERSQRSRCANSCLSRSRHVEAATFVAVLTSRALCCHRLGISILIPVLSRSREDTLYRSKPRVQHRFTGFNSAGVLQ